MTTKEKLNALNEFLIKNYEGREWIINITNSDFNVVSIKDDEMRAAAKAFLAALEIGYNFHKRKANKYITDTIPPLKEKIQKAEANLKEYELEVGKSYMRGYHNGMNQYHEDVKNTILEISKKYVNLEKAAFEGNQKAYERGLKEGKTEGIKLSAESYGSLFSKATDIFAEQLKNAKENVAAEAHERGIRFEREDSFIPSNAYDLEVFAVKPTTDFPCGQQAFIGFKCGEKFNFIQIPYTVTNPNKKHGNNS